MLQQQVVSAEEGRALAEKAFKQASSERAALEQQVGQAQWSQSRAEEQVQSLRQQLATVLEDHKVAETGRMQAEEEVGRLHKELLAWSKRDAAAERSLLQMQVQLRNTGLHMASTQFALQQQAEVARQLREKSALQMRSFGQQLAMVSGVIQSSGEQLLGASGAGSSSSAP